MILGMIPISIKKQEITYTIHSPSLSISAKIKEELIVFYKQYCYSSLFSSIDNKIKENIDNFKYDATYIDNNITITYINENTKMVGSLYSVEPPSIIYKYYFTSVTNSIPEATSISEATSKQFDQIWYETPL